MNKNTISFITFILAFLPACASSPAPSPSAGVRVETSPCGLVVVSDVRDVPVPGSTYVADITTVVRPSCATKEGAE